MGEELFVCPVCETELKHDTGEINANFSSHSAMYIELRLSCDVCNEMVAYTFVPVKDMTRVVDDEGS